MISYDMERTVWNTPIALSIDHSENQTESSFKKNNFKNIELFETIQETFKKARSLKWKIKNLKKKSKKKSKNVSNCSDNAKKARDKKNPVYAIKDIYKRACDGVTSIIMYQQPLPQELSSAEYKNMIQGSKWLQSRVGEFFVVLFTMIITFSVMFYSTDRFIKEYYNPVDIITGLDAYTEYIYPLNIILGLFLQDVLAPFTILLNLTVNFIPQMSNLGLSNNPHIFFIVLFGAFFGCVWAIYQNTDWFLNMFFESFKWKINGIMFLLVFVHIFVRTVVELINPSGFVKLMMNMGLGGMIVWAIYVLIRILIALFLIPIAQAFFGFGFLLLFIIFPIGIGLLSHTSPKPPEQTGGFNIPGLSSIPGLPSLPSIPGLSSSPGLSGLSSLPGSMGALSPPSIPGATGQQTMLDFSSALSPSNIMSFITKSFNKSDETFKPSLFPILYAIPEGLGRTDLSTNLFTRLTLKQIINIIFIIFFIIQMTQAAKYTSSDVNVKMFFIVYTVMNSFIPAYILIRILYSQILYPHFLLRDPVNN